MNSITVAVTRWDGGWELEIDEDNITQVRTLTKAPARVRDYLDTLRPEEDHSGWTINLKLSSWQIAERICQSREATLAAQKAQEQAARETREVVNMLLAERITVNDAAALLDISSGRISQLKKDNKRPGPAKSA